MFKYVGIIAYRLYIYNKRRPTLFKVWFISDDQTENLQQNTAIILIQQHIHIYIFYSASDIIFKILSWRDRGISRF